MNIRNISLLGSLVFSSLLTLGACGSSSSSGTGGTTGSLGGTTGSHAGTTGSFGGTTGAAGGHVGAAGGTIGSAGGTIGSAGGTTGSAGGSSGTCTTIPSCVQALVNCGTVAGTCVQQMTGSAVTGAYQINTCYSNGVKQLSTVSVDLTTQTGSISVTVSKGGTVCYTESETQTDPNQTSVPITIKNAAGTTVATLMDSADGTATVVTCTGGTPVTISNDCMPAGTSTTGDCTDGVCQ